MATRYIADRKCNGTAGEGVTLDSAVSGAAGGWVDLVPANLSLARSLAWIGENAVEGGVYTVVLYSDESLAHHTLSCGGKNVNIILTGGADGQPGFKRESLYRAKRRNADAGQ
jgi:hypothetical protein